MELEDNECQSRLIKHETHVSNIQGVSKARKLKFKFQRTK